MQFYTSCKICNSEIKTIIDSKRIVVCSKCKLIFFNQKINDEEVTELYKKLYESGDDNAYNEHIRQQQLISHGLQPKIGYNKKIILNRVVRFKPVSIGEIGAGVGLVGKYLTKKN